MGCMAQREKEDLAKKHPIVDLVVGTDQFVHLPELLARQQREGKIVATEFGDFETVNWSARRNEGITAYVPVMRGCNYSTTYCITKLAVAKSRAIRPFIEREVRQAVEEGFKQVTLLGQTVDAYGKTGDGSNLAKLLHRLHPIDGLERIRFITSHPKDITDELLETMAELPKVAKHLHVPAQSGSSRILRLMGRRYTREQYLDFVERARRIIPGVELLTDMIVGFPRETDEDFQMTRSLMEEVQFDGAFVFMYSPRPDTGANRLEDDVEEAVKKARCNDLLALQLQQQTARYAGLHGQTFDVLVEGPSKNPNRLAGRSIGNLNIIFDRVGENGVDYSDRIGSIVPITITESTNLTLFGVPA